MPCGFPDFEQAVQRMSKVLTFQTVSDPEAAQHLVDPEQFRALDAYLAQAYPKVRAAAACTPWIGDVCRARLLSNHQQQIAVPQPSFE